MAAGEKTNKAVAAGFVLTAEKIFQNIQENPPLMHNIANIVTANDCANITLACGGSPTMADDPWEVEEITSAANGLVINMGHINGLYVECMLRAGKRSNLLHHPVVLDPVGAGAAKKRNETLETLLESVKFSVIRGNSSEIKFLGAKSSAAKGVDADESDKVTEDNLESSIRFAKELSRQTGAVIAMSGTIDIVADSTRAFVIRNGHPMMSKVTGTGCMLSSAVGVFVSANPQQLLEATAVAVSAYGYAGELAYQKTIQTDGGTSSFRMHLIDYMSKMNVDLWKEGANLEVR